MFLRSSRIFIGVAALVISTLSLSAQQDRGMPSYGQTSPMGASGQDCQRTETGQIVCQPSIEQTPIIRGQERAMPDIWDRDRMLRFYPPLDPEPPTEFQHFVEASVGQPLEMFGHKLFNNVPITFTPALDYAVPSDYVVGPGDQLMVRAWGSVDMDVNVTVDRSGNAYIPRVGSVTVAGLRFDQLNGFLKSEIGRFFKNFDMQVSLGRLRSIQVFVVGQARRPGTYSISSLSTLVNALFVSGGPSVSGSMRRIAVNRGGKTISEFDLYDLLARGDKSKDVVLQSGDVVYIPPVGPLVAVSGSVNVPSIYELRGGDTLGSILGFAGGYTPTAAMQQARIERIVERKSRSVIEMALDAESMKRSLQDGDIVRIIPISPRFDNSVTLRGHVAEPGRYSWHPGMRIRDLIPGPEALIPRRFWQNQNALGLRPVNPQSRERNETGEPQAEQDENRPESAPGQPNPRGSGRLLSPTPGQTAGTMENPELKGEKTRRTAKSRSETDVLWSGDLEGNPPRTDLMLMSPEVNWEYAVIQRLNESSLITEFIAFMPRKAILEGDEANNLELRPGDMITFFSEFDLASPVETRSKLVRIEGEVGSAGIYRVRPGETLRGLLARAGGLSPNAYLFGTEFTRRSTRAEQQKRLDQFGREFEQEIEAKAANVADEGPTGELQLARNREMLQRIRAVVPSGKIVLEIKPDAKNIADIPDIALEDGDRLYIPYRATLVNVIGAVYNENSFMYRDGMRANDYLRLAGGPRKRADVKELFIIRANGSVVGRSRGNGFFTGGRSVYSLRLYPGDSVVVPADLEKIGVRRGLRDWTNIISQFALGVAAVRVLAQ